jgi:hypothetical protein
MAKARRKGFSEVDLDTLEAFDELGRDEGAIADRLQTSLSTVQARLKRYDELGLLQVDEVVHWGEVERIKAGERSDEIVLNRELENRRREKAISKSPFSGFFSQEDTSPEQTGVIFSAGDLKTLQALARDQQARWDRAVLRSGTRKMASFRLDSGLLDALKSWAKDEGITDTEAVNQAIEALLGRR